MTTGLVMMTATALPDLRLGRRGDGDLGPLTIWRRIDRLRDIVAGYHLARGLPTAATYG